MAAGPAARHVSDQIDPAEERPQARRDAEIPVGVSAVLESQPLQARQQREPTANGSFQLEEPAQLTRDSAQRR